MSSEVSVPVPVPRTGVPLGITDPVERARAELKAALAAIEEKANVPRRVSRASDRAKRTARDFAKRSPVAATAAVLAGATVVGALVWSIVRAYTR
jgi:xanthine dehydrogenase iron-sulfur cluster and FAD-binding subunit A